MLKTFYVPITKRDDAQQMVWGYASTPARDYDGDVITLEALTGSLADYMKFANIREMHQMSAVGVAKEASVDKRGLYVGAHIVDPLAWLKVTSGTYKAFSIGGNATKRAPGDPHTITGLQLIEISLVDRPANPEAVFEVFKAAEVKTEKGNMEKPVYNEQADEPVPAAVVLPPEVPAARIARCLKADKAGKLTKAVAQSIEFTDKQLSTSLKLDEVALKNWLANNHQLLEKITKAIPDDSPLWTKRPDPVVVVEVPKADDVDEAAKAAHAAVSDLAHVGDVLDVSKKGDKPAGDYGSHDEACYADPGYQDDKKPRYPLKEGGDWSDGRIRAAWNYINKPDNQKAYSADQVAKIKAKIVSAWKAHIDSDGPPSADSGKNKAIQPNRTETPVTTIKDMAPDAKGNLRKGLLTASAAIALMGSFERLTKAISAEAAYKGDTDTDKGSRFVELLKMLTDAVQAYVDEEVDQMLTGDDTDVMPVADFIAHADTAGMFKSIGGGKTVADGLVKALGDRTGDKGFEFISQFAEEVIAKSKPSGESGDWDDSNKPAQEMGSNDDWKKGMQKSAQSIHDMAKAMGAKCEGAEKAAEPGKTAPEPDAKDKPPTAKAKAKKPADDADAEDQSDGGADESDEADDGDNPPKPKDKAKKAAQSEELALVAGAVANLASNMDGIHKMLAEMRKNPPRPKAEDGKDKPAAKQLAVDKGDDVTKGNKDENDFDPNDPKNAAKVLKAIHQRPNVFARG